jgi:hypothetical protein
MIGDVGFDPFGYSGGVASPDWYGSSDSLKYLREAEITHGRIAQLAVLGFIWPATFGSFPGNDWTGADAYNHANPFEAFDEVPRVALVQILITMGCVEVYRLKLIKQQGEDRVPGDLNLGQGGYNPYNLNYSPEEYEKKQLQELKHCRLAMLGVSGLFLQARASGLDIASQLGAASVDPAYHAKAGYFFPEGI